MDTIRQRKLIERLLYDMGEAHYIYKITIVQGGMYYIGCTKHFLLRLKTHQNHVISPDDDDCRFYKEAHRAIMENQHFERWVAMNKHIRTSMKMSILAVVTGKQLAFDLERRYIQEAITDPLCLNGPSPRQEPAKSEK
jgi:predicted GIY-YIG superfamily endonuclease